MPCAGCNFDAVRWPRGWRRRFANADQPFGHLRQLESQSRQMHNRFPPLIAERVTTARRPREMATVAGGSDDLFGIDVMSGEPAGPRKVIVLIPSG